MKPIIINMDEMSDSREVYESKPGKAGILFIYMVFLLVIIAVIWMAVVKIDVIVKSEAVLRPNDDISTVVNQAEGKLTEVNVADGDRVSKGDCLYRVDVSDQEAQKTYYEEQIKNCEKQKKCLELYKKSVNADKNLLKKTGDEEKYYAQFESYLAGYENATDTADYNSELNTYKTESYKKQLKKKQTAVSNYKKLLEGIQNEKNEFSSTGEESVYYTLYTQYESGIKKLNQQYDAQKNEITSSVTEEGIINAIEYYNQQKTGLETLIKSISKGKSYFKESSSYALQYEEYENKVKQIETAGESAEQTVSEFKTSSLADLEQQLSDVEKKLSDYEAQKSVQVSKKVLLSKNEEQRKTALEEYQAEFNADISAKIKELEDVVDTLENNLKALELEKDKSLAYEDGSSENSASVLKTTELKTTMESIENCEKQISEQETQLETVQKTIDNANVTAEIDGVVNMASDLVKGDVMTADTEVMTIIPDDDNEFKANIYVANSDIGKLKEGMKIKLNIYALPNSEYGYISGKVISISKDIKVDSENSSSYYLLEASVDSRILYDKDGNAAKLKSGMAGKAKVITGEKSILRYVLERLSLWSR